MTEPTASKADRIVTGVVGRDQLPPFGFHDPAIYKAKYPGWWPENTDLLAIEVVRIRRPKKKEEGQGRDRIAEFRYKRGLAPA